MQLVMMVLMVKLALLVKLVLKETLDQSELLDLMALAVGIWMVTELEILMKIKMETVISMLMIALEQPVQLEAQVLKETLAQLVMTELTE